MIDQPSLNEITVDFVSDDFLRKKKKKKRAQHKRKNKRRIEKGSRYSSHLLPPLSSVTCFIYNMFSPKSSILLLVLSSSIYSIITLAKRKGKVAAAYIPQDKRRTRQIRNYGFIISKGYSRYRSFPYHVAHRWFS